MPWAIFDDFAAQCWKNSSNEIGILRAIAGAIWAPNIGRCRNQDPLSFHISSHALILEMQITTTSLQWSLGGWESNTLWCRARTHTSQSFSCMHPYVEVWLRWLFVVVPRYNNTAALRALQICSCCVLQECNNPGLHVLIATQPARIGRDIPTSRIHSKPHPRLQRLRYHMGGVPPSKPMILMLKMAWVAWLPVWQI